MLVYIKPLSIFPELHSDTLFGAITYAISELYPEKIEDMLSKFKEEPPFIISSTLPFAFTKDKKIRFYPKIILSKTKQQKRYESSTYKKYKKINYVEEKIFFKMISGDITEEDILNDFDSYKIVKDLLMTEDYGIKLRVSESIIPNNSINRVTNKTEGIFYTSGKEFKNLGLFFFCEFNNKEYEPIVKSALKFLKDKGFGKDISTGKGQFDYEIENISLDDLGNFSGDYFITLSRFIPNKEDLKHINEFSTYEIDSKRGKSYSGEIRKRIRFFKEGSIFPNYKRFYGRIVESGKNSPAIEYGFAFPIKCGGDLNG